MWEAIRRNRLRSKLVIALMAMLLIGLGALLGRVLVGPGGGAWGAGGATLVWALLMAITFLGGEPFLVLAAGAREVQREDAPRLWNVVEEMSIASGLARMPRIYILDSYMQNAFAVGRTPDTARLIVTEGLARRLSRDELQGVVAHEIGHIRNYDVRFMTIASVMLGGVTLLADTCRRVTWFGGGRRSRLRGSPQLYLALMGLLLLGAMFAPLCARLLYLMCSREREFLADASAARYTRYPEGLASALEKIAERQGVTRRDAPRALVPMYIVNPLQGAAGSAMFRTHPPTEERVRILRSMAGAGWAEYERAYRQVYGNRARCLDRGLVASSEAVACRAPSPEVRQGSEGLSREVVDVGDRDASLVGLLCACGLRIKVPEKFPRDEVRCPRCGHRHRVPQPEPNVESDPVDGLAYERKADGWEAFRCSCGRVNQLSPGLRVDRIRCRGCQAIIRIRSLAA